MALLLLFYGIFFVVTGIAMTMLQQPLFYQGAAGKTTLLPTLVAYMGVALNIFLPLLGVTDPTKGRQEKKDTAQPHKTVYLYGLVLGVIDVLGTTSAFIALAYIGSGMFQVLYSAITIFTALLSRIVLDKKLNFVQWFAILFVTLGLAVSTIGKIDTGAQVPLLGIALTLCATGVNSASYVTADYLVSLPQSISTQKLASVSGGFGFAICLVYQLLYTLPNWETLFVQPVTEKNGNHSDILFAYLVLMISSLGHSWSYYGLIASVGSVGTGILQSLRAVLVFFISDFYYCSTAPEQCISRPKIVSTCLVIFGILIFINAKTLAETSQHVIPLVTNKRLFSPIAVRTTTRPKESLVVDLNEVLEV